MRCTCSCEVTQEEEETMESNSEFFEMNDQRNVAHFLHSHPLRSIPWDHNWMRQHHYMMSWLHHCCIIDCNPCIPKLSHPIHSDSTYICTCTCTLQTGPWWLSADPRWGQVSRSSPSNAYRSCSSYPSGTTDGQPWRGQISVSLEMHDMATCTCMYMYVRVVMSEHYLFNIHVHTRVCPTKLCISK